MFKITLVSFLIAICFAKAYKLNIRKLYECENPVPPYESGAESSLYVVPVNNSGNLFLNGNFTVKENLKNHYWNLRYVTYESGKVVHNVFLKKVDCKGMLPRLWLTFSKVKYDIKTCVIYKGVYKFNNLDLARIDRAASSFPVRHIGEAVLEIQFYGSAGTNYCYKINHDYTS